MRGFLVVYALCLSVLVAREGDSSATNGCHPTMTDPILRANLDRDRALEEVTVTNVSCAHEYAYGINDECRSQKKHHWLAGSGFQDERRIFEANGAADGREFFYVLRRGPHRAPDLGTAAIIHLVTLIPDRCPVPRSIFLYRTEEPLLPPLRGFELARFDVNLVELSSRYWGKEIRLTEAFTRAGAERRRVTLLRYSRRADRYVVYSPKL